MTSDLQALLTAIVANPADDVARLVYADCLEEHGNAARAAFIRLQIEAERHHPDSKERADLDRQADDLLEAGWTEWWAEVCAAVGFPAPVPRPTTRLGRLARRFSSLVTGAPYTRRGCWLSCTPPVPNPQALGGFAGVWLRRGFPDEVVVSGPADFLRGWVRVAPLRRLTVYTAYRGSWSDGPHLAGVRSVGLMSANAEALPLVLDSPYLGNLEDLSLPEPEPTAPGGLAADLARLAGSPRARQLKRAAVWVWDDRAAEVLAGAASLAGLEALWVSLEPEGARDPAGAGRRLATLARSPHLAGLKELAVEGGLDPDGIAAAIRQPTWKGLRKLSLRLAFGYNRLTPLAEPDGLPQLEDFSLLSVWIDAAEIDVLVRSPLLKRLRHFSLAGTPHYRPVLAQLAGALAADRVETFALHLPGVDTPGPDGTEPLRKHFGEKLRVFPAPESPPA